MSDNLPNLRDDGGRDIEEDEKSEDPPTRRERSPSAMSHSSAVLEWDPSADVGAMGISSESKSAIEQKTEMSSLQRQISECNVVYAGPSYDLEGGQPKRSSRSNSESSNSQKSKPCASSTPSRSPVPLASLQYSPVPPQDSNGRKNSQNNVLKDPNSQNNDSPSGTSPFADSSDDNNQGNTGGETNAKGRVVSDVSTDWEYDREKHIPSKSLSQWQTSGMTRSEIEYQNKKNSVVGSTTSMASSVFMLKVDTNLNYEQESSPPGKTKQTRETSSSKGSDLGELEQKIYKTIRRHQSSQKFQHQDLGSSESDPSSMCVIVEDFVKLLENNPSKENIKYDVLKNHRDYHLMKVWKQISKLERINMNLLSCKRLPVDKTKRQNNIPEPLEREDATSGSVERVPVVQDLKRRPDSPEVLSEEIKSLKGSEPTAHTKARHINYSSEPLLSSKKIVGKKDIGITAREEDAPRERGLLSFEALRSRCRKPHPADMLFQLKRRLEAKNKIMGDDVPVQRREIKPGEYTFIPSTSAQYSENNDGVEHSRQYAELNSQVLREIVSKFVEEHNRKGRRAEKHGRDRKSSKYEKPQRRDHSSDKGRRVPSKFVNVTRETENVFDESFNRTQRRTKSPPKTKSPVGFYVPLFTEGEEMSDDNLNGARAYESHPGPHRRSRWVPPAKPENGLYDLKDAMKIQDCLIKNNPHCYKNIKERDEFLINIRRDRQVCNETFFRDVLRSEMTREEIRKYLKKYFARALPEEKKRLQIYWDLYLEAQKFKEENLNENDDHVISLKEMKERTARLRKNDPVVLDRQKKEADERRRMASRNLQKDFSSNLRRFQQMGTVNVPDRMKLGKY